MYWGSPFILRIQPNLAKIATINFQGRSRPVCATYPTYLTLPFALRLLFVSFRYQDEMSIHLINSSNISNEVIRNKTLTFTDPCSLASLRKNTSNNGRELS